MVIVMVIVMVTIIMMAVMNEEDKDDEDEDDGEFCGLLHDWFVITWSFWMPLLFFCGTGLPFPPNI